MNATIKYCPYCGKELSAFIEKTPKVKIVWNPTTDGGSFTDTSTTVTWTPPYVQTND